MIRAVLFDLDGTLFDRDASIRVLAKSQYARFGAELAAISEARFVERLIELDDHGHGNKRLLYETLSTEMDLAPDVAARLEADFWAGYHEECLAKPGAREVLRSLRNRGLKLGLVTNGRAETQNRTVDAIEIRSLLDTCVISEVENLRKPEVGIFHLAASRLGVEPEECVFVGDHPVSDIEGATRSGMLPVWIRVSQWDAPKGVAAISQLDELESCLFREG